MMNIFSHVPLQQVIYSASHRDLSDDWLFHRLYRNSEVILDNLGLSHSGFKLYVHNITKMFNINILKCYFNGSFLIASNTIS